MKRKLVFLGVMLGLGLADSAMAHVTNVPLTLNATQSIGGLYNYGWADGLRLNGTKAFGGLAGWTNVVTQAAESNSLTNYGDSHYIQNGGASGGSTLVTFFTFNSSQVGAGASTFTITVTDTSANGDTLNPAVSVYKNTVLPNAHDGGAPCPAIPGTADGAFNATGSFSLGTGAANSCKTLTYVGSAHGATGTTETLQFTADGTSTYTIILGGEHCVAYGLKPYTTGYCRNEGSHGLFPSYKNANTYSATVKVTKP